MTTTVGTLVTYMSQITFLLHGRVSKTVQPFEKDPHAGLVEGML